MHLYTVIADTAVYRTRAAGRGQLVAALKAARISLLREERRMDAIARVKAASA